MSRSLFFSLLLLFSFAASSDVGFAKSPNVIVILTDDQGWGDLSIHGNTNLHTPHVDSLAKEGALFENFYVCPVCAPTRAEFLTGRYHPRGGVRGVSTGQERLNIDENTIAEEFVAAGYETAAFGKWHNGTQYPYHPKARGFSEYFGFTSGHWGNYFSPILDHNGVIVRGNGYLVDDLTDHALQFIEQNRDRPFFCYLPYNTPHSPFQVPEKWYSKFRDAPIELRNRDAKKEELDKTRAALAMCENIDWNVGRVLEKLDELKLTEETIIVYFTDNGPNTWRWNGGMKGKKGSTDEGGVRVPCLVRWPRKIEPGTKIKQIAGAIDLLPTLLDLTGVKRIVGDKPLDGISLKPELTGKPTSRQERMIFSHWNGRVSVRTERYRLDHKGQLYDLVNDPGQDKNIANENKELADELKRAVAAWKKDVFAGQGKDDRPYPVGFAGAPETQLPARDGEFSGTVKRSGRAPNCSYFTNWTSPEDRIWWDVEVLETGIYDVAVFFTCPEADTGSKIELSCGDNNLITTLQAAHDPPITGAEHDRADRGSESFVRDFHELSLGRMKLSQGRAKFSLRALEVPGKQVMDVRMIVLRKH